MKTLANLFAPTLAVALSAAFATAHDRPIIGILAQETISEVYELFPKLNFSSYVAGSYVQWVQAAGARAAPVFIRQSPDYYAEMFSQLNGLLLPGGDSQLDSGGFGAASRAFWDLAHAHPETYFPIWGTCQGHEELAFLAAGPDVIAACNASNQATTTTFNEAEVAESRLFGNASQEILHTFGDEPSVVMFHYNCVKPDSFERVAPEFHVLGSSYDWNGQKYASVIEHRDLPIYGVQFHPEKPVFEWSLLHRVDQNPHTPNAIAATQYLANFFVEEARKNEHRFKTPEAERKALFYNYRPLYTGGLGLSFEQIYFF